MRVVCVFVWLATGVLTAAVPIALLNAVWTPSWAWAGTGCIAALCWFPAVMASIVCAAIWDER